MFAAIAALTLAVQSAPAPDFAPDFSEACGTIDAAIGSGTIPGAVFVVGRNLPDFL